MQDSRVVFDCFLCALLGSLHVLHQFVQYLHEDLFHLFNSLHYLSNEIQETLLFGKCLLQLGIIVLTMSFIANDMS